MAWSLFPEFSIAICLASALCSRLHLAGRIASTTWRALKREASVAQHGTQAVFGYRGFQQQRAKLSIAILLDYETEIVRMIKSSTLGSNGKPRMRM